MPAYLNHRNLRNLLLIVAAMAAVMAAVWLLRDPLRSMMATADDVRAWLIALGPLAPAGYFAFYAAQIIFAPLPGSFPAPVPAGVPAAPSSTPPPTGSLSPYILPKSAPPAVPAKAALQRVEQA